MSTEQKLEEKLWSALSSDRTVMLGLNGVEDGHARPMTALVEGDRGPIWFFTSQSNAVVENLARSDRAIAAFSAKDHDLFASIHGKLSVDQDRQVIDRLWNPFIAAWYDGKDDPKLVLLRFDAEHAGLLEHGVDQRGFPVVDVGDDRDVAELGHGTRLLAAPRAMGKASHGKPGPGRFQSPLSL